MNYKIKYLKYKKKNLELQNQLGGINSYNEFNKGGALSNEIPISNEASISNEVPTSKEMPVECNFYNYEPKKCNENNNCEWDFRNLCIKKGKGLKLPKVIEENIGSYLSIGPKEYEFILNEISLNLEYARKYANKGNVSLVNHCNNIITKHIEEIKDTLEPKKKKRI